MKCKGWNLRSEKEFVSFFLDRVGSHEVEAKIFVYNHTLTLMIRGFLCAVRTAFSVGRAARYGIIVGSRYVTVVMMHVI